MGDERSESLTPGERRESLAEYLRRVRAEKELSMPVVARKSGDQISTTYIWQIEQGLMINVSDKKLRALARGLGVLASDVLAVAHGPAKPPPSPDRRAGLILGFFHDLPTEARQSIYLFSEWIWQHEKLKRRPGRHRPLRLPGTTTDEPLKRVRGNGSSANHQD